MHRILPSPSETSTIEQAYTGPLGTREDRPWVGLCMVASLDGSTVVDGASAGLSSENDSGVLLRLRALADVLVVGAGTARGEGYGPPSKPGQRIGVVTRSGSVDTSSELFTSGAGFVITTSTTTFDERGVDVVRAGGDEVDLAAAMVLLDDVAPGARYVQVEGGPSLNGAFADADLFDELNLTTSPALVGGDGPRLVSGAGDLSAVFELVQMIVDDEAFVFSRWRRRRGVAPASP
ncbi:MAG: dihydrofolate reductase family protein [Ilumatobacter sp.]|uniref:dihydrofolate reductase family protein n=1 Tax=Ilumatobacter sp. TaxID=1967498 RepID=UPI00329A1B36